MSHRRVCNKCDAMKAKDGWNCARCLVRHCRHVPSFSGGYCGRCVVEVEKAKARQAKEKAGAAA